MPYRRPLVLFFITVPTALIGTVGSISIAEQIKAERTMFMRLLAQGRSEVPSIGGDWEYMVSMPLGCRMQWRVGWLKAEMRVMLKANGMPDCNQEYLWNRVKVGAEAAARYAVTDTLAMRDPSKPAGIICTYNAVDSWFGQIEQPVMLSDGWPKCGPPPPSHRISADMGKRL